MFSCPIIIIKLSNEVKMSSYLSEITKIFEDELNANILFLLDTFGPLNLQGIIEILKKPKTTVSDHLKKLVENNQIIIDEQSSSKKKIFYKLNPVISELINQEDESISMNNEIMDSLDIHKEDFVHSVANILRSIGFQANLFSRIGAQYLEDNIHLFSDIEKNKKKLRGFVSGMNELVIKNDEEYKEVWEILKDFENKLKKFEKSKRKKGRHSLMIFWVGVPKDIVGPKK
ncbi:MAG: ArsR family transcriptional regulator [Promethearchaeota archaeon]|nr:MAG: ArsR family transcriptional regulator [Candidatus Lokiarchaeota archaeon]